ncbi:hypothetical protein AR687_11360 [Flavobacteriaceae bacterium CRH]|nr:hypothetical protein AR687_11360 [Flavobacteriaceae bacterium CRH]
MQLICNFLGEFLFSSFLFIYCLEHFYFEAFSWLEKGVNKGSSFLFKNFNYFQFANLQFFFNLQMFSSLFFSKIQKAFFTFDYIGNCYICGLILKHI